MEDKYYILYKTRSSELVHRLYNLGYTPHSIVQEAYNEHMSVYEYIAILFDLT